MRAVQASTIAAKRAYNSSAPINKIPLELFLDVIALSTDQKELHLQQVQELSTVSYGWRRAIEDYPPLWAILSSWDPPDLTTKALEIASDCPLEVTAGILPPLSIRGSRNWDDEIHTLSSTFMNTVLPHSERWKSADLQVNHRGVIKRLEMVSAPTLKRLALQVVLVRNDLNPVDLFGEHAPCLRSLHLSHIKVPPPSSLFDDLEDLELCDVELLPAELLGILSRSPNLTTLDLLGVTHPIPIPSERLPDVQLPHLQEFRFSTDRPTVLPQYLLPHLSIPADAGVSINFSDSGAPGPPSRESLQFVFRRMPLMHTELKLTIQDAGFSCNSYKPPSKQKHYIDLAIPARLVNTLIQTLPSSNVRTILRLVPTTTWDVTHIYSFLRVPNVKVLQLDSWFGQIGEGPLSPGGLLAYNTHFPALEHLILRRGFPYQATMDVIRSRPSLKKLDVWADSDDWDKAKLEETAGDTCIRFHDTDSPEIFDSISNIEY